MFSLVRVLTVLVVVEYLSFLDIWSYGPNLVRRFHVGSLCKKHPLNMEIYTKLVIV